MTDDRQPKTSPITDGGVVHDGTAESAARQLLIEISKALLTGSLAATRGALQILQGVTGLLLASYTAVLAGVIRQVQHITKFGIVLAALPIFCYVLSLIIGFLQIVLDHGDSLTLGDLPGSFAAYEARVSTQRKQLVLPLAFLLLGVAAVVFVVVEILRSTQIALVH